MQKIQVNILRQRERNLTMQKIQVNILRQRVLRKTFIMRKREIDRTQRLISYLIQFNRLRFQEQPIPEQYSSVIEKLIESLPEDERLDSYARLELPANMNRPITYDQVGEFIGGIVQNIIKKNSDASIRATLSTLDLSLYDPPYLSDISSEASSPSMAQEVPDLDEPMAKKKKEN